MPELPEVETVKETLKRNYLNRRILKTEILLPRMILSPIEEFKEKVNNVEIIGFDRKGKYLFFHLSNGYSFISHLRMEGKYILRKNEESIVSHTRVIFYLDNNEKLCYDDSRSFGIMRLCKTQDVYSLEEIKKLGPEPFDIDDSQYLYDIFSKSKKEIKTNLLDQTIMTGLGNIYCDEVLFASNINPYTPSNKLSKKDCENILNNSKLILKNAIELGGSTVSSYHPQKGVDGKFQNELLVYGKVNQKCSICNSILRKDELNGRGTTYCPKCQNAALSIGITGKIASGKSYVLEYIKKKGYPVFSCDSFINDLYKTTKVKHQLVKMFGEEVLNDDTSISKGYIKNVIIKNEAKKKELEKYIHPLVKEGIIKFIHNNKQGKLTFVEVPLMFETNFYRLFDMIIGISCSSISQINHLKNRKSDSIEKDLLLNQSTTFDKNVSKCDYLVNNDGTLSELEEKIDSILENMLQ